MSSKTKIVVVHLKEVIYTGIFVLLGILFLLLLVVMFLPKKSSPALAEEEDKYIAGVYTSSIMLNDNAINLEVTVDTDYISSIRLVNLEDSVAAMYPLMEPALEQLTAQIYKTQSLENITYPEDNQYTSKIILDAIESALHKASAPLADKGAERIS